MDIEEYRQQGKKVVDFIYDFRQKYDERRVIPDDNIKKGFLNNVLSGECTSNVKLETIGNIFFCLFIVLNEFSDVAPEESEDFDKILSDFQEHVMPGLVSWDHKRFHAYFPGGGSYPSYLADMISTAVNQIGFSWVKNRNLQF